MLRAIAIASECMMFIGHHVFYNTAACCQCIATAYICMQLEYSYINVTLSHGPQIKGKIQCINLITGSGMCLQDNYIRTLKCTISGFIKSIKSPILRLQKVTMTKLKHRPTITNIVAISLTIAT